MTLREKNEADRSLLKLHATFFPENLLPIKRLFIDVYSPVTKEEVLFVAKQIPSVPIYYSCHASDIANCKIIKNAEKTKEFFQNQDNIYVITYIGSIK